MIERGFLPVDGFFPFRGLNSSDPSTFIDPRLSPFLRNVEIRQGVLEKRRGYLELPVDAGVDGGGGSAAAIAVGATGDDDDANQAGAVYILFLNTDGTVYTTGRDGYVKITDDDMTSYTLDANDEFGWRMASVGDLDGDGTTDLAVTSMHDDDGDGDNRGAVYILFLDTDGTVDSSQKISDIAGGFEGPLSTGDLFGSSVTSLGDTDGAGRSAVTLAVGASSDNDGGGDAKGAVWLLFLETDGTVRDSQKISSTAGGFSPTALDDSDLFGNSVASLGDLNGDQQIDLAVGACLDDDGQPNAGAVYILFLKRSGKDDVIATFDNWGDVSDTWGFYVLDDAEDGVLCRK